MSNPVFHIDPNELNDVATLRFALIQALNFINTQHQQIQALSKQVQELKDEIARLKGEQGKPNILPNAGKSPDISSERHTGEQKEWKKKPKKDIIKIDSTEHCPIDKAILPDDAQFKGYETVIGQDIIFKRNNTEYRIEIWYSPSQNKTYRSKLPASYTGYFSNPLKAFCITMHYALDVTRNTLITFLSGMGIEISDGSLQNILTENSETWLTEKNDLLKAGLHGLFIQTDSTGTRVHGQNQRTHVFVSEFFAVFSTQTGKSRLDILNALQGQPENGIFLQYNQIAVEFLDHYRISPKDRQAVEQIFTQQPVIGIKEFDMVATEKLPALKKKTTTYKWVVESLALGYYFEQTDYPAPNILVTDDAREYILLAVYRMLCWIHDARYYNKLTPLIDSHRKELEIFKDRYWCFYDLMMQYKQNPTKELKRFIENEFDEIFTPNTPYFDLNKEIQRTRSNKEQLLTVLDFPFIPLHNNASELAARRQVRKRDIHLHTMTGLGTKLQDAFMSIIHTSFQLGINAYQYIQNRIDGCSEFYLPDLVLEKIKSNQGS
ncbi:MAG: transposase [Bacteroidota bacterium]